MQWDWMDSLVAVAIGALRSCWYSLASKSAILCIKRVTISSWSPLVEAGFVVDVIMFGWWMVSMVIVTTGGTLSYHGAHYNTLQAVCKQYIVPTTGLVKSVTSLS
jgi:hypothetical protein